MIQVTDTNGQTKQHEVEAGSTLMEVLRDAGYQEIIAICGGSCSCATCHVHISPDPQIALHPIEEDELLLLEMTEQYEPGKSRLSCQIELDQSHHGLQVTLLDPE